MSQLVEKTDRYLNRIAATELLPSIRWQVFLGVPSLAVFNALGI